MSEQITLRDHSEPCEHPEGWSPLAWLPTGAYLVEEQGLDFWMCGRLDCPGGREVTLQRTWFATSIAESIGDWPWPVPATSQPVVAVYVSDWLLEGDE